MLDNLTIDTHGRILMQEDPGSTNYLANIFDKLQVTRRSQAAVYYSQSLRKQ